MIFSNSAETAQVSKGKSSVFVEFIAETIFHEKVENINSEYIHYITILVRKSAHFFEFAVLSFLIFATLFSFGTKEKQTYPFAMVATFFVACGDEIIQYFTPGRACRFYDVMIDSAGGLTALVFVFLFMRLLSKNIRRGNDEQI
jgi:VanZ family protein